MRCVRQVPLTTWALRARAAAASPRRMTERDSKVFIPEIDIFVNDLSLPLWLAIPPREAARIAIEEAERLDQRLSAYSPALLEELYATNPRWVERARHRSEHLDEAGAALRGG